MVFSDLVAPFPPAVGPLGRLRVLSPKGAGIRSSPLFFGGISLGTAWNDYQPGNDKAGSFKMLDEWLEAGGVSIDTSNVYSVGIKFWKDEESETILGEWMTSRNVRDRMVIATKYSSSFQAHKYGKNEAMNASGNSRKSLHISLKESLRKLQTDYVDILYIHYWDWSTTVPEVMDALDICVKQGKVLYIGASDLPAWITAACNEYASARGKTRFSVIQTKWNVMDRDIERDILPMARHYDMAVVPFSSLGSGKLKNQYSLEEAIAKGTYTETSDEVRFSRLLLAMGKKRGIDSFAPIALAYLMSKYALTFPIIGFNCSEQLNDCIRSLTIRLTQEEMTEIESVRPLDMGFPNTMIGENPAIRGTVEATAATQTGAVDWLVKRDTYISQLDL